METTTILAILAISIFLTLVHALHRQTVRADSAEVGVKVATAIGRTLLDVGNRLSEEKAEALIRAERAEASLARVEREIVSGISQSVPWEEREHPMSRAKRLAVNEMLAAEEAQTISPARKILGDLRANLTAKIAAEDAAEAGGK